MREYFVSVGAVSVICAVATLIGYRNGDKGAKIALSVLLLYTLATPVISFVESGFDFSIDNSESLPPETSIEDTVYYDVAKDAFADGVVSYVCNEFSLDRSFVSAYVYGFDIKSMRAEKIKLILTGRAVYADARAIVSAVRKAGLGECEVELEFS